MPENPQFVPEALIKPPKPRHFLERLRANWEVALGLTIAGTVALTSVGVLFMGTQIDLGIIIGASTVLGTGAGVAGATQS